MVNSKFKNPDYPLGHKPSYDIVYGGEGSILNPISVLKMPVIVPNSLITSHCIDETLHLQ